MNQAPPLKQPVYIVGSDHHSTLSLIRCFGETGCDVRLILHQKGHTPKNRLATSRSKYARNTEVVSNSELIPRLREIGQRNTEQSFLIPAVDFSTYHVDINRNDLSKYFIIHGIRGRQGAMAFLMDKHNQNVFAKDHNIPVADSLPVDLSSSPTELEWEKYPCIVKPQISLYGSKIDVTQCDSRQELNKTLATYRTKQFPNALIQEKIRVIKEFCGFGSITDFTENTFYAVIEKIRRFPSAFGSASLAVTTQQKEAIEFLNRILSILKDYGYRGLFDIEFFETPDGFILNEINFRQSGNAYVMNKYKVYPPVYWCLDAIGERPDSPIKCTIPPGINLINEMTEYELIKRKPTNLLKFLSQWSSTSAYAAFDIHDLNGTFARYRAIFR